MMEENKVLLEVNEDSSQRGGCCREAGENQREDRPAKHRPPATPCPWSSPVFPTLIRLLLRVFGVLLSWAWASSPTTPSSVLSSSRQKQSSGRLMRPLPYFRRCCETRNSNPHNPQWSTMGMAAIKYFATKPGLCVWWGWGGGAEGLGSWIFGCQCEQQEGSRLDMRHWVLVGRGVSVWAWPWP